MFPTDQKIAGAACLQTVYFRSGGVLHLVGDQRSEADGRHVADIVRAPDVPEVVLLLESSLLEKITAAGAATSTSTLNQINRMCLSDERMLRSYLEIVDANARKHPPYDIFESIYDLQSFVSMRTFQKIYQDPSAIGTAELARYMASLKRQAKEFEKAALPQMRDLLRCLVDPRLDLPAWYLPFVEWQPAHPAPDLLKMRMADILREDPDAFEEILRFANRRDASVAKHGVAIIQDVLVLAEVWRLRRAHPSATLVLIVGATHACTIGEFLGRGDDVERVEHVVGVSGVLPGTRSPGPIPQNVMS